MKELKICGIYGGVALAAAAACHLFAPGLGMWLKPLFWPLAALGGRVRTSYAVATACVVPFVSCALTGMPAAERACSVAVLAASGAAVVGLVRRLSRKAPAPVSRDGEAAR